MYLYNARITMLSDYRYITFNRYYMYVHIYICMFSKYKCIQYMYYKGIFYSYKIHE